MVLLEPGAMPTLAAETGSDEANASPGPATGDRGRRGPRIGETEFGGDWARPGRGTEFVCTDGLRQTETRPPRTGLRSIAELIEELRQRGGGVGLFTGCAAGDTGAALLVRVED